MLKKEVKKNMAVKFVRRNGQVGTGVVSALPEVKTNGTWVEVNTGDKKNPVIAKVRLEKLERADATPAAAPMSKPEAKVAKAVAEKVKTKPGLKTLPPVAHTTLQPEAKWPFPGTKPGAAADALAAAKKPIATPKKTPAKSAAKKTPAKPAAKTVGKKK